MSIEEAAIMSTEPHPTTGGIEPIPPANVDPLEQLAHIVPALWRTIRRAARSSQDLPANESHVGILRMLITHGELTPAHLAELLNVARSTVSNLLKSMIGNGLVERRIDPTDTRVFLITATERGRSVLEAFRADRVSVIREACERMSADETAQLRGSVPALRRLLRELEVVADGNPDPGAIA